MRNAPQALINTTNGTAGTVSSPGVYLGQIYSYSLHVIAGAGGTGSIIVQASNDNVVLNPGTESATVVNWTTLAGGTIAVAGAGSSMTNFDGVGYAWVRVLQVLTGGTAATLAVNFFSKGV